MRVSPRQHPACHINAQRRSEDARLGNVGHGTIAEAALDLVVGEFDEGVVLFRQFVGQHFVVFFAQCFLSLVHQPLADQAHLEGDKSHTRIMRFWSATGFCHYTLYKGASEKKGILGL